MLCGCRPGISAADILQATLATWSGLCCQDAGEVGCLPDRCSYALMKGSSPLLAFKCAMRCRRTQRLVPEVI